MEIQKGGDYTMENIKIKETKEAIRQLRNFNLSDEEIAVKVKVTTMTIKNWGKGTHAANYATREKLFLIINEMKKK